MRRVDCLGKVSQAMYISVTQKKKKKRKKKKRKKEPGGGGGEW